jgi:hypothetical protein
MFDMVGSFSVIRVGWAALAAFVSAPFDTHSTIPTPCPS